MLQFTATNLVGLSTKRLKEYRARVSCFDFLLWFCSGAAWTSVFLIITNKLFNLAINTPMKNRPLLKKNCITILVMVMYLANFRVSAQTIRTIAGGGTSLGDGGAAIVAQLGSPQDMAVDRYGNVYIADFTNCRIRKVSPTGIITTVAGNGSWGYSGDGGQATAAQLNYPNAVAIDTSGNLFIGDFSNYCIRKVNTSGIISTYAGTTFPGYSGDYGPATAAELWETASITVDNWGNLFIAEFGSSVIRKVNAVGVISTIAGTGGTTGYTGDGGPATAAILGEPYGVASDNAGNIYILLICFR